MSARQMTTVTCPSCRMSYSAAVINVIDVGKNPRLKTALLQGQVNAGTCPQCGTTGILNIPFVYHDPEKELLFCLVPQELGMREAERQRVIGEMSRAVMNSLPTEQRKGYLLQPRIFITYPSLLQAILEADGVTQEMLQARERKVRMINQMVESLDDGLLLASMIRENQSLIDTEFFVLLSSLIKMMTQSGQAEQVERLNRLQTRLMEQTEVGQDIARQQDIWEQVVRGLDENLTQDELIRRMLMVPEESADDLLGMLIGLTREWIDYRFFQVLTEQIGQAQAAGDAALVQQLKGLRTRVLRLSQEIDAQRRALVQEKAQLLHEIVQSPDIKAAVEEHITEIDQSFLTVLRISMEQSEQEGQAQSLAVLQQVREAIEHVIRENTPAEFVLIERLLHAQYPDETRQILHDASELVTPRLIEICKTLLSEMADESDPAMRQQLEQVMAQAQLMVGMAA